MRPKMKPLYTIEHKEGKSQHISVLFRRRVLFSSWFFPHIHMTHSISSHYLFEYSSIAPSLLHGEITIQLFILTQQNNFMMYNFHGEKRVSFVSHILFYTAFTLYICVKVCRCLVQACFFLLDSEEENKHR